jgi:hypothetical protein
LFKKITIRLENGKQFIIETKHNSKENVYIQSATLNGIPYGQSYITHSDILQCGTLKFVMTKQPNQSWGMVCPVSKIQDYPIVPVPFVAQGERIFSDSTTITLSCLDTTTAIFYAYNSKKPINYKRYTTPITIKSSETFSIYAKNKQSDSSQTASIIFTQVSKDCTIEVKSSYSNQYSAGGDHALIDGIRGGNNFRTGAWQGYYAQNVEAIICFQNNRSITSLSLGCLQDQNSWIFLPKEVAFYSSIDGINFQKLGVVENKTSETTEYPVIKDMALKTPPTMARYIKMIAKNRGKCPDWHVGAGDDTWIFVDEIAVK